MKRRAAVAVLMMVLVVAAARGESPQDSRQADTRDQSAAAVGAETSALIKQYCVACHNQRLKTGGLILDTDGITDIGQHAEVWEKVVTKLRTRTMPPVGRPRPNVEVYDAFAGWLEKNSRTA